MKSKGKSPGNFLLLPRLTIFLQKRIKCDLLGTAAVMGEIKNFRNVCSNICMILFIGKSNKLFQAWFRSGKVYVCCLGILWLTLIFLSILLLLLLLLLLLFITFVT
jgi:hypothetical protein